MIEPNLQPLPNRGLRAVFANAATQAPPRARALIADDQPDVVAALHLLLRGAGYQIEAVDSPSAVIEAIKQRPFDLVLMDLNYRRDTTSGLEGLDLITQIRNLESTLPVMVLTGWGSIKLAVEAMHLGARDFVLKPWDNSDLLKSVRAEIENGRRRRRQKSLDAQNRAIQDNLRWELTEATEIQQALMPENLPAVKGFELAVAWRPASAVGGDYFDVIRFNDRHTAICIADVAGKGLPAALLMSNVQAVLKSLASPLLAPAELCARVNRVMCDNVVAHKFISFFYALVDTDRRTLLYANAGHCPPMLMRDRTCLRLQEGGPVLGIFPDGLYLQHEVALQRGDRMALFTDGITEARNPCGREFGDEGLREILARSRGLRAGALRDRIMNSLAEFSKGVVHDDATLMLLTVE